MVITSNARSDTEFVFISYLVTKSGITDSIISSFIIPKFKFSDGNYLLASPTGRLLMRNNRWNHFIEYYSFDNQTGTVSNRKILYDSLYKLPYYVEFSYDETKLYLSYEQVHLDRCIVQYNMKAGNETDIINSRVKLFQDTNGRHILGEFRLGPDRKIYLSIQWSPYLAVINYPEKSGESCGFELTGVDLEGGKCDIALPRFLNDYKHSGIGGTTGICEGETFHLYYTPDSGAVYKWTGPNNFSSTKQNPVIANSSFANTGLYNLKVTADTTDLYDTVYVNVLPRPVAKIIADKETDFCKSLNITLSSQVKDKNFSYLWSTGEKKADIIVKKSRIYKLTVTNSSGCSATDSIFIKGIQKINISVNGSASLCVGDTIELKSTPFDAEYSYKWSTGDTTPTTKIYKPGTYKVVVTYYNCKDSASIKIDSTPKPYPRISGPNSVCSNTEAEYFVQYYYQPVSKWEITGGTLLSGQGTSYIKIQWGSKGKGQIIVTQVDTTTGCRGIDTLEVLIDDILKPKISSSSPVLCPGGSVTISAPVGYSEYKWNTGDTTREITVTDTGSFYVNVKETVGCQGVSDTIYIKEATPPTPTINGDTLLCPGRTSILLVKEPYTTYNWSTGETTQSITISTPGTYSVLVTDTNGCTGSASFEVKQWSLNLSQLNDLIFSKIDIGKEDTQTFLLTNNSDGDINIASISIKGIEGSTFELSTNPPVPTLLPKGQSINITVKFKPQTAKKYLDSILISIDKPCPETRALACFGEAVNQNYSSTVWLPDTTAEIGYPDFRIPLRAKMDAKDNLTGSTYKAEIRYNGAYFQPNFVNTGTLTKNEIENGERILNIEGTATNLNQNETILTEISGLVLLANEERIPLKITNFTWGDTNIVLNKINGSLQVTGTCVQELSMLKLMDKSSIEVVPNPVTDEINIQIIMDYSSQVNIKLYNSLGLLIESNNENEVTAGTNTLVYKPKAELSSGTYWLRVETGRESWCKPFLITQLSDLIQHIIK